jgi:hypothetical protein
MTSDQSLVGQTIAVTLTVQLVNYPMITTTASFNVLVTATADCNITTISFQDYAAVFSADFNKVTNWTLTPATDSYSLMMADPMFCGPTQYIIAENYSWLSVVEVGSQLIFTIDQTSMTPNLGTFPVSLMISKPNYGALAPYIATLELTITDPCAAAGLQLFLAPISSVSITVNDVNVITSLFEPTKLMLGSQIYSDVDMALCGTVTYDLSNTAFVSSNPPPGNQLLDPWTLSFQTNDPSLIGT